METQASRLPRYAVAKSVKGWAIIDRSKARIKMHNDVIEVLPTRNAARAKCHQLNDGERDGRAEASPS